MFEAPSIAKARWFLVSATCVVTILWLCAIFAPYDPVTDPHGYNSLFWAIICSGLHIICGAALFIASQFGVVRVYFAILVLFTPLAHVLGSAIEAPGCFVPFLVPSILIILAGSYEVAYPTARVAPPIADQEP
jgi:hypothetical protein